MVTMEMQAAMADEDMKLTWNDEKLTWKLLCMTGLLQSPHSPALHLRSRSEKTPPS